MNRRGIEKLTSISTHQSLRKCLLVLRPRNLGGHLIMSWITAGTGLMLTSCQGLCINGLCTLSLFKIVGAVLVVISQGPDTRHFYHQNEWFDFCYCSGGAFGSLAAVLCGPVYIRSDHTPGHIEGQKRGQSTMSYTDDPQGGGRAWAKSPFR